MEHIERAEIDLDYWEKHCVVCRAPIEQPPTGRPRLTCSARCRKALSRQSPDLHKRPEREDREARQRAERTLAEWEARYGPYDDTAPRGGISPRTRLRMYLMRGAPLNYCRRCGRPTLLDEVVGRADDVWGRREDPGFCSETCARAYHEHNRAVYRALDEFEGDVAPVVKVRLRIAGAEGLGVCETCGRPFPDYGVGRKHCSKRCRQAAWRGRRKKCVECGAWFSPTPGYESRQQYCSDRCQNRVKKRTARRRQRQHDYRTTRRCAHCRQPFERNKYAGRRHRFCSPACQRAAQSTRDRRLSLKQAPVKYCAHCRRSFKTTRSAQRYCSAACRIAARRQRISPYRRTADPRPCARCGELFRPQHKNHKYCSAECRRTTKITQTQGT